MVPHCIKHLVYTILPIILIQANIELYNAALDVM